MNKQKLKQRLLKEQIVVFGTGNNGNMFYDKYHSIINITGVTSSFGTQTINDMPRVDWKCKKEQNYLYIICCADVYGVSRELMKFGYEYGVDFLTQKMAETILDDKKLILLAGQCELEIIHFLFESLYDVSKDYNCIYYMEKDLLEVNGYQQKIEAALMLVYDIEFADVLIVPANLSKDRIEYYGMLENLVGNECIKVSVPCTTFEGYWPNDVGEYYGEHDFFVREASGEYPFGGRTDDNIENAVKENIGKNILQEIESESFYSPDFVLKNLNRSIRRYEIIEKKSVIKISDFIKENYLKQRIFLDRGHVADFVLVEYAYRILNYLGINIEKKIIQGINLDWYNYYRSFQPIYKSVQKVLHFEEPEQYQIWINSQRMWVKCDEYYKLLYDYMEKVKGLRSIHVREGCFLDE